MSTKEKKLQENQVIVESLIRLRDEMRAKLFNRRIRQNKTVEVGNPLCEAYLKINSCLYSRYPHKPEEVR